MSLSAYIAWLQCKVNIERDTNKCKSCSSEQQEWNKKKRAKKVGGVGSRDPLSSQRVGIWPVYLCRPNSVDPACLADARTSTSMVEENWDSLLLPDREGKCLLCGRRFIGFRNSGINVAVTSPTSRYLSSSSQSLFAASPVMNCIKNWGDTGAVELKWQYFYSKGAGLGIERRMAELLGCQTCYSRS